MRGIGIVLGLGRQSAGAAPPPPVFVQTRSGVVDGVDEYVDLGAPASFSGNNVHLTAAVWFKTEQGAMADIFGKWAGLTTRDWVIWLDAGQVYAYLHTSTFPVFASTVSTYNDNAWHLAVMTWDGVTLTIDIDGGAERQQAAVSNRRGLAGSKAMIGARDDGAGGALSYFNGNADEALFFSGFAITAAQCIELYSLGGPATAGDLSTFSAFGSLTSWYRMGDSPGDSMDSADPAARIFDAKGSNDGTPVNTEPADIVLDVPPTFNRLSLLTDGVDEYAELAGASVTGCEFDWDDPFSVSVWFKTTNHTAGAGIIASKMQGAPHYRGWTFGIYAGNAFFGLNHSVSGGQYLQAYVGQFITTGAWKHLVVTCDGSGTVAGCEFYLNGTNVYPAGQTTASYIDTLGGNTSLGGATAPLVIGCQSATGQFFDGDFDEVSVWSKQLGALEIAALADAGAPANLAGSANLDAWYRCGEAAGDSATGTIHDVSGNANNLAATNMEAGDIQAETARPFKNLLSIDMDGVDERLYSSPAGNAPIYDTADPFSVSCWFKTSTATYGALVAKESSAFPSYVGWCLLINNTNALRIELSAGGAAYIDVLTTTTGWNDSAWHHVLFCWDGSGVAAGVTFYIDGALQATTTLSDALGAGSILTTKPLTIGCRGNTTLGAWIPYAGRIDEVSLYNTTLSAANATEIYNNGMPRDVTTLTTSGDLDAYYRCGDDTFDAKALGQPTVFDITANNYDLWQANMEQSDFAEDTP